MANRLVYTGLEELKLALRSLPEHLTGEAVRIVEGAANGAEADMVAGYEQHRDTGNLRNGLKKEVIATGPYGAGIRLKNTSPHAYIFENGTQVRHTKAGVNRGAMPAFHVFIPAMVRARKRMYSQFRDLLKSAGLQVTGDV